jgi:hypothetical protein
MDGKQNIKSSEVFLSVSVRNKVHMDTYLIANSKKLNKSYLLKFS